MDLKNRIKKVRTDSSLTQREFCERINVAQATYAQFESGTRVPRDVYLAAICREFSINENWLRNGIGLMYNPKPIEELDRLAERYNLPPMVRKAVEMVVTLNDSELAALNRKILEFTELMAANGEIAVTDHEYEGEELSNFLYDQQQAKEARVFKHELIREKNMA